MNRNLIVQRLVYVGPVPNQMRVQIHTDFLSDIVNDLVAVAGLDLIAVALTEFEVGKMFDSFSCLLYQYSFVLT